MGNIVKNTEDQGLTAQNLDELFDGPLKPMNSRNARLVYKIFFDAKDQELTTVDLQQLIQEHDRIYNKKDLHNWLNDLMSAGLITKESERGKPTKVEYNGRYTYDIWHLTPQGYQIGRKIERFLCKYPNLNEQKTIEKTRIPSLQELKTGDLREIESLYINSVILLALHKTGGKSDLNEISRNTILQPRSLHSFLEAHIRSMSSPLYQMNEKTVGIGGRILQKLGLSSVNFDVSLSPEGKKISESLLKT
jgi:DNA-binding HxlR family transcriptional regulator